MDLTRRLGWIWIAVTLLATFRVQASSGPETIEFKSGDKVLHGLLYKPPGKGPFPAVLYNHGGSPGLVNNAAFDAIAPHRESGIHIYPPFAGDGDGGMQGHSFAWLGVSQWFPEAFGFVAKHCGAASGDSR